MRVHFGPIRRCGFDRIPSDLLRLECVIRPERKRMICISFVFSIFLCSQTFAADWFCLFRTYLFLFLKIIWLATTGVDPRSQMDAGLLRRLHRRLRQTVELGADWRGRNIHAPETQEDAYLRYVMMMMALLGFSVRRCCCCCCWTDPFRSRRWTWSGDLSRGSIHQWCG